MHLDLDNVEGAAGDYNISVAAADAVLVGAGATQTLDIGRQAARRALGAAHRRSRPAKATVKVSVSGPSGFALERSLRADRAAADANPGAAQCAAARQGRERDAVERHVRRSRAGHRQRVGLGRVVDRARCRDAARGARPLSVRLLRADHQPGAAAALCQRSGERRRTSRSMPRSSSASATPSIALLARQDSNGSFGLWCVGRRRSWLDCLCHRLPDAGARTQIRGARHGVQAGARPAAQLPSPICPIRAKTAARDLAYALYVLARNGVAPIGDLRYLADTKLDDARDADRQGADRRRAWRCWATACAPSVSMRRRWRSFGAAAAARASRPRGLRLDAARCGGRGDARGRRRRAAQPTIAAAVAARRGRRARCRLRPRPRKTPGWCWRRRASPRSNGSVSLDVGGEKRQGAALPRPSAPPI